MSRGCIAHGGPYRLCEDCGDGMSLGDLGRCWRGKPDDVAVIVTVTSTVRTRAEIAAINVETRLKEISDHLDTLEGKDVMAGLPSANTVVQSLITDMRWMLLMFRMRGG